MLVYCFVKNNIIHCYEDKRYCFMFCKEQSNSFFAKNKQLIVTLTKAIVSCFAKNKAIYCFEKDKAMFLDSCVCTVCLYQFVLM